MQTRGYFDFETTPYSPTLNVVYLWEVKIKGIRYYGRDIDSFIELLDNIEEDITLWAFNLTKYEANYVVPTLFSKDDRFKYVNKDFDISEFDDEEIEVLKEESNKKIQLVNIFKLFKMNFSNKFIYIYLWNKNGCKVTMYCALNSVGGSTLKQWGKCLRLPKGRTPLFDKSILNKKLSIQIFIYLDRDVDIVERIIENLLYVLNYDENKYKPTLASYANWYWEKNLSLDWKFYHLNKIQKYEIEKRLRSAFFGGCNYVSEKYIGKVIPVFAPDKKSAYPFQLISKPMPILVPIECKIRNKNIDCEHDLSILSITYYDFKLKKNKLPVLKERGVISNYVKKSKSFNFATILQEHKLVFDSYSIKDYDINWKYCFDSSKNLFVQYFKKFFTMKELTPPGIEQKMAKTFANSLWGQKAQNILKDNKFFELVHKDDLNIRKTSVRYKSSKKDYYWIEKNTNKSFSPESYFTSFKAKYLPLAIFTTAYQRIEMIEVGNANYNRVVWIDTDCVCLYGNNKSFILPQHIKDEIASLPEWCKGTNWNGKKYHLGEWEEVKQPPYQKILGAKLYIKIDEKGKVTNLKGAGVVKSKKIIEFLDVKDFNLGMTISDGAKKATVLPSGGVEIRNADFIIKDKKKSSLF